MNRYQTLAANTALISIGTFASKLLMFFMVRFYTGYLTPTEYGIADLITQTANLLIPVVSLDIVEGVFPLPPTGASTGRRCFPWVSGNLLHRAGGSP